MKSKKKPTATKKLSLSVFAICFVMLVGMTIYEYLKQLIFPTITIWQSHIITILFCTVCATVAAFFILRKHVALTQALIEERTQADHLQKKLKNTIAELKASVSEVKTLTGLLPICASCKKIKDDKGYWNQIEAYISKRAKVDFSHGICPECAKKQLNDLTEEKDDS